MPSSRRHYPAAVNGKNVAPVPREAIRVSVSTDLEPDSLRYRSRVLMLPEAQDYRAVRLQSPDCVDVPHTVPRDLLGPEASARPRRRAVLRAAEPEAAADEHRDRRPCECDIRTTPSIELERMVGSVSQIHLMKRPPDGNLQTGVSPTVRAHRRPSCICAGGGNPAH